MLVDFKNFQIKVSSKFVIKYSSFPAFTMLSVLYTVGWAAGRASGL